MHHPRFRSAPLETSARAAATQFDESKNRLETLARSVHDRFHDYYKRLPDQYKVSIFARSYSFIYLGFWVLIPMAISWLFLLSALVFGWPVNRIGSLMVCGALIADLAYSNWSLRELRGIALMWFPLKHSEKYAVVHDTEPVGNGLRLYWPIEKDGYAEHLRRICPFHSFDEMSIVDKELDATYWSVAGGLRNAEGTMLALIVLTGIIGTVLWGYGDCNIRSFSCS